MTGGLQRFIRDVGWSFASLAISALIHFILRVFLARYLGADELGLYSLSFAAYSFGLVLSGFGIGSALTKYAAQYKDDSPRLRSLLSSGCAISLAIGCLMGVSLYFLSPVIADRFFHMPEMTNLLRIVAFAFPFIALQKASLGFLNGLRRMRTFAIINVAQNVLVIILTAVLVVLGHGVSGAVLALVVPVALFGVLSIYPVRRFISKPNFVQHGTAVKALIVFGLYVVLTNSLGLVYTYTDSIMLGYFMNDADVGIYAVAIVLAQAIQLPFQAIQMITNPTISTYWGKGEIGNIEDLINSIMKYTAVFIIPIGFVIAFLAPEIITLIFGTDFALAVLPLQILLIGMIFAAILVPVGGALASTAYVKIVFKLSGITAVINIILNLLLIPHLGITGAAIATSTSLVIGGLLNLYFTKRLVGVRIYWSWFVKLVIFTALLAGATYGIGFILNHYVCVCVSLVIFVVVLLKYFISKDELTLLRKIVPWGNANH